MRKLTTVILVIFALMAISLPAYAGPPNSNCQGGWCDSGGGYATGRPQITNDGVYNTRYITAPRGSQGVAYSIGVKARVNGMGAGSGWKPSGTIQSNGNGTYTLKYVKRIKQ